MYRKYIICCMTLIVCVFHGYNQVTFTLLPNLPAANINRIEYFFDTDPGFGKGVGMSTPVATDISNLPVTADITALSAGIHRLYIRSQDAGGNWSLTNVQSFFILFANVGFPANPSPASITQLEYFIDTDPGFGKGSQVSVTPGTDINPGLVPVSITGLSNGVHHIYVRTKDANGSWA